MKAKLTKAESQARAAKSLEYLRELCPPGTTVYTYILNVSRSGMQRNVVAYVVHDNQIVRITHHVSNVSGVRLNKDIELVFGGCGFDAGYEVVDILQRALGYDLNHRSL